MRGWQIWSSFIEAELQTERERRALLDARAVTIVTSSSALVSLVFAIGALTLGSRNIPEDSSGLTAWSVWPAAAGLVLFTVAAAMSLVGGRTVPYAVAEPVALDNMTNTEWNASEEDAAQVVMYYNVNTITTLRDGNKRKARMLVLALLAQISAVFALAFAVTAVMIQIYL